MAHMTISDGRAWSLDVIKDDLKVRALVDQTPRILKGWQFDCINGVFSGPAHRDAWSAIESLVDSLNL